MKHLQQHKQVLAQLALLINQEMNCAAVICPENVTLTEDMQKVREKSGDSFVVLVMGMYSSGKSSLVNALLGENLLPTGFLPETAVLCQLEYSTEKKIIVYPKPDAYGEKPPIVLTNPTPETLRKYASIDNEAGLNCKNFTSERIESKFQRLVIRWPLEILKDGVVLVDSPGLNDPYNNDYITRSYLPAADAVIYVMNSLVPYCKEDRNQLSALNTKGMRNILFGCTYFDRVEKSGVEQTAKARDYLYSNALQHTDLDKEGVHFLSSIQGLVAKQTGNTELYQKSGFEGFEEYLSRYLVERKGTDQVKAFCERIEIYAQQLKQTAISLNAAAGIDTENLQARIVDAGKQLSEIQLQAQNTVQALRDTLSQSKESLRALIKDQLIAMPDQVSLSDYEPKTRLPKGFDRLNPISVNKKSREFNDECTEEFCNRVSLQVNQWIGSDLSPELERIEQEAMRNVLQDLQTIAQSLENVELTITGGKKSGALAQTLGSTALSVALGLLMGSPYYAAMSSMYGIGAAVKGLSTYVGLSIAAEIAKLCFSITVSGGALFIVSTLADILFIVGANERRQEAKILKAVEKNGKDMFRKDKSLLQDNVDQLMGLVDGQMEQVCAQIQKALEGDIQQKKDLIEAAIQSTQQGVEEKQAAIEKRKNQLDILDQVLLAVQTIRAQYGIGSDK